jgi:hypothetical protein
MRDGQMSATEDERNRVLRRADWRFLLPAPDPVCTVLYTNGALGEAVRAVSERVVDGCHERPHGECDLAVAVDPDEATLREAWAALRPGGSCYTEWSAGSLRPAEVDRRLRRNRFLHVTCYIPRPDPHDAAPQAWVPLGVAAARRWYLHRTRGAPGLRHALGRARRELGWRLASWCRIPSVLCVVARKPPTLSGGHTSVSPVEDFHTGLCRVLRAGHSNHACPALPPWVLLTQGAHSLNKIVLLMLTSGGEPEYVVKVPRTAAAAEAIEREASVLKRVHAICHDVAGIPRVVFTGSAGGVRLVVETPVHGTPLSRLVHRADYRTLAVKATDWQATLIHAGGAASSRRHSIGPILEYLDGPLSAVADPRVVTMTKDALGALGLLPTACEQRDFAPWNIFVTPEGELSVVDWESAEPHGLPALDLIYFLTYLAVYRERASTPDDVHAVHRSTVDASTPVGKVTRECLERYVGLTKMNARALAPLRVLCWLVHSRSEYARFARDGGGAPDPAALRNSLFVRFWQQELQAARPAAA